jgi:hypothetical protein
MRSFHLGLAVSAQAQSNFPRAKGGHNRTHGILAQKTVLRSIFQPSHGRRIEAYAPIINRLLDGQ